MEKSKINILRIIKRKRFFLKTISLTLILTLLFTSMPLDGFAALAEQWVEDFKLITIEKELEQYRTEFTKTYLKSDGSLESVVSSNPIHFKEDGEWVEIDSTLEADENEKGTEILKNKKGSFNVELPAEIEKDSEIAIEKGKNKISIKLLETKNSKAKKNKDKKEKAEKITKSQRKRMTAGELFEVDNNQTSTVEYSAVYSDTNIRYDVTPNEVKESIVLQKAPNKKAAYSYEISAKGLTAVLNEDNSIDFYEGVKSESTTPVFSMPSPYMFDSKGEYSYDIATTLENKKDKYILTYKPSYDWLKDKNRSYPVTVDPTVVINSGIQDSYTFSGEGYKDSYTGYEQQLKVGTTAWITPNDYWQTYLKFTDLPQIPYEDYRIDSAYLMLTPKATTGNWQEMELGVYELTEDWKNHQTGKVAERLTFNNAPADVGYSTATASVARGGADNGVGVGFEIAHLVEKWYDSPETNFGLKLAAHLEASQWNDNLVFHSSRSTTGTAPYLSLTYTEFVPVTGIEIVGRPENDKISIGKALSLTITTTPENASDKADIISNVVWNSDNPDIAEIDPLTGDVTAKEIGTTTISAVSGEYSDSFALTVGGHIPDEIDLLISENQCLFEHEQYYLSAITIYQGNSISAEVEYHSNNPEIASVSENGIITANSVGTAVITVFAKEAPEVKATATITVVPIQSAEIVNLPENNSIDIYKSHRLDLEITADNHSAIEDDPAFIGRYAEFFDWSSSNPAIATVDEDGTLQPHSIGTTVITVSRPNGGAALDSFTLTVYYIEATGIEIIQYPTDGILRCGEEFYLRAEISPDNASEYHTAWLEMCWQSDNPDVLTVDPIYGIITAVGSGTAHITVEYYGLTDTIEITVPEYTYDLNKPFLDFLVSGNTHQLITNANEYIVDIEDLTVISADDNGVITALESGTTKIYIGTNICEGVELYEYTITVIDPVEWKLDQDEMIYCGETYTITNNNDVHLYAYGTGDVQINNNNSITATDLGEVTIEASYNGIVLETIRLYILEGLKIAYKPQDNTIYVGQVYKSLSTIALPSNLPCEAEWWSSDESIAEIYYDYAKGRVVLTGKSEGSVWIGAESPDPVNSAQDGFWLYVDLISVESFTIVNHPDYPALADHEAYIGDAGVLKAQITPDHEYVYYNEIEWNISDGNATGIEFLPRVEKNEKLLRIKKAGTYEISATIDGLPSTNKYTITVKKPKATITDKPQNNAIYKGGTHILDCKKEPTEATVEWVSKNESIATVDKATGKITAKSSGYVVIAVKIIYKNRTYTTDSFTLNVRNQWIWVDGYDSTTLIVGDVVNLRADVGANAGNDRTVAWKSSNSSVASVDSNGKVTANAPGTVTITAYLVNRPEVNWPAIFEVNSLLIYQTKDIPGYKYNEATGKYDKAEDMCVDDVDLSQISITAPELADYWRYLCMTVTTEPLQTVGLDMIDHFISGSGLEYSDPQLTKAVLAHESTITYLNVVKEKLLNAFGSAYDVKTLSYNINNRDSSIMVEALKGHYQPIFNTDSDKINGLTFCIDSLWGHKIELVSYEKANGKYTAKVKITFYDHFGLDSEDIDKYGYLSGFRAWYTLQHAQHFNGAYKPFITLIETNMQFSGNVI